MSEDSPKSILDSKLAEINRAAEERDSERRSAKSGHSYVNISKVPVMIDALGVIPEEAARAAKVAAIEIQGHSLAVAAFDPNSPETQAIIHNLEAKKYVPKLFVSSTSGLEEAWRMYKFVNNKSKDITGAVAIEKQRFETLIAKLTSFQKVQEELASSDFSKLNTTALFEIILAGALANGASDLHFEAEENSSRVRYRLDGVLHDAFSALPLKNYDSLVSRIKLLSGLKINLHGEPQDGRFTINLPTKEIEMRVSIIPSEYGETIVMRVLDPDSISVGVDDLGIRSDIMNLAKSALAQPNGLILNTGPTGSGKTTTLYAFLKHILSSESKIITIEDPIEYHIEGIEQTQVNSEVGYTFSGGLRAILRQDPDIILVGEIRDEETADIAMQASLTGHMVLSTLHANDAVSTITRLRDLGVNPETIGPALSLVIAQRLLRKLCVKCRKEVQVGAELAENINSFLKELPDRVDKKLYENYKIYEAGSCEACNGIGYRGRIGVFEFLVAGPELEELILKETSEVAIRNLAKKQGLVTFKEDGILKVLTGVTSFDEVEKITGPIDWSSKDKK